MKPMTEMHQDILTTAGWLSRKNSPYF